MTATGYLNSIEALEHLGLYNPAGKPKPNVMYLKWLERRGLLKRTRIGHRTFLYKKTHCLELFAKAQNEGLILTSKK